MADNSFTRMGSLLASVPELQQAQDARDALPKEILEGSQLFLVSPMRRALRTATIVTEGYRKFVCDNTDGLCGMTDIDADKYIENDNGIKLMAHPDLREWIRCSGDVGSKVEVLKKELRKSAQPCLPSLR